MDKYTIATLSDDVVRESVTYKNRYGFTIAADLYLPKKRVVNQKYPALIIGAPYGGVKEQGPSVYANQLAHRGFVALTFDPVFMGESSGKPRHTSSPDLFSENFSAAVDYLGLQSFVDREKIGVIGICGSGGFALNAAQCDTRIKAIATVSMYDINLASRLSMSADEIQAVKEKLSNQRWIDAEKQEPEYVPIFPETPLDSVPSDIAEPDAEWLRFYATKRGHHPSARGGFTTTSTLSMMNFKLLDYLDEISPRPILFVVADRAHSKIFSEIAYEKAGPAKEMLIVEDAEHIDLYDRIDRIPFDRLEAFFQSHFNKI